MWIPDSDKDVPIKEEPSTPAFAVKDEKGMVKKEVKKDKKTKDKTQSMKYKGGWRMCTYKWPLKTVWRPQFSPLSRSQTVTPSMQKRITSSLLENMFLVIEAHPTDLYIATGASAVAEPS